MPRTKTAIKKPKAKAPRARPLKTSSLGFALERSLELEIEEKSETYDVRLELLRSRGDPTRYRARLWRLELFRIQSTSPQNADGQPSHEPSDELIMKEWESLPESFDAFEARDLDAAERHVLKKVDAWLRTIDARMR